MRTVVNDEQKRIIKELVESGNHSWAQIGTAVGMDSERVRGIYRRIVGSVHTSYQFNPIKESPYPKYNQPLEQTGDCLILPDPEFPYHHAEFMNRCIELAVTLKVRQCNIAGDAMHFNSISHWEANWKSENQGDISDKAHDKLMEFMQRLPEKLQGEFLDTIEQFEPNHDDDIGGEVETAKHAFRDLSSAFDEIVYVIGNHDGRLLSALNSPMFADQLKQFTVGDNPKYKIAPYYYSILHTEKGDYRIEHPVGSAQSTAVNIANQFHCHVIMGHSHSYSRMMDASGKYFAIQTGCCVDEDRLAYCSQRTRGSKRHVLGACLVKNGYPYDLNMMTDWNVLKKIA
ncbi:MAG: hypothetical protein WC428_06730 [Candidatus Paceibacterota bacterium]